MPVCLHCGKLIKPLGMPVDVVEEMETFLATIIEDVYYESGQRPPHYSMPVVPLVVEYAYNYGWNGKSVCIVVWKEPCTFIKEWTYHVSYADTPQSGSTPAGGAKA